MANATQLTLTLRGKWHGRYGIAPCPKCQPEARRDQNALTLADGENGLLAHCKNSKCDFAEILAAAGIEGKPARSEIETSMRAREPRRK